jgi:hypothetical protein
VAQALGKLEQSRPLKQLWSMLTRLVMFISKVYVAIILSTPSLTIIQAATLETTGDSRFCNLCQFTTT